MFFFHCISATPTSHEWRSDKDDLSKMFDIATPNPTGSLSGPWFDLTGSGNVTGVRGRNSHLACRVKNLANQTVSQQKTTTIFSLLSKSTSFWSHLKIAKRMKHPFIVSTFCSSSRSYLLCENNVINIYL